MTEEITKPKRNYWKISMIVIIILLVLGGLYFGGVYVLNRVYVNGGNAGYNLCLNQTTTSILDSLTKQGYVPFAYGNQTYKLGVVA